MASKNSKNPQHGVIWWLCISWWWLPIKWVSYTIPCWFIKKFISSPNTPSSTSFTEVAPKISQLSSQDVDIFIPSKKDGAPLLSHYRVKINLTNKDSLLQHHKEKEWYFSPIEIDGDIHLFMGEDEIGILIDRTSMLKDWLRRGDPYILCFDNLSEENGCFGHVAFYRDKLKEHEWREKTIIALDAYKSKDRQNAITALDQGDELRLINTTVKMPSYNVLSGRNIIGKLPKECAKRVFEEGIYAVFFEESQYGGDYKDQPFVRIYWTNKRRDLSEEEAAKYNSKVPLLEFSQDKLSSKKALQNLKDYVVLDCETTGLSPSDNEIIEIAMSKYIGGEKVSEFSSLVQPFGIIPARITEITGITNLDVASSPIISEIVEQMWDFIAGFTLVGHNIPFDIGFLKKIFSDAGYEGKFKYVDTLKLARTAFPEFPNHKLETCINMLSLSDGQTHRALDDVECTQKLLEKCLPLLLQKKELELAEKRAKKVENAQTEQSNEPGGPP